MGKEKRRSALIRTIKTVVAAVAALSVARLLGLDFAANAAIIAILCVFDTRVSTFKTAKIRIISAALGLAVGTVALKVFGQNTLGFAIYLLVFLPLSFFFKLDGSIGPTSVLITHLIQAESIGPSLLLNEMLLMVLGAGFAALTNIYAPSEICLLKDKVDSVDKKIKDLLNVFSTTLTRDVSIIEEKERLDDLLKAIEEAEALARIEVDNLKAGENDLLAQIVLRRSQYYILEDMFKNVKAIPASFTKGGRLAEILNISSQELTEKGAINEIQKAMDELKVYVKTIDLPKTYGDMTIMSNMYQILKEFDEFIKISKMIDEKYRLGDSLKC